jgi:hypothetical protein
MGSHFVLLAVVVMRECFYYIIQVLCALRPFYGVILVSVLIWRAIFAFLIQFEFMKGVWAIAAAVFLTLVLLLLENVETRKK